MPTQFLPYRSSSIAFYVYGRGPQLVLCFHGYGESGEKFAFLGESAGDSFCFICPDLPFHGNTVWNEGYDFKPSDLVSISENLLEKVRAQLEPGANQKIYLVGYSLGARMLLHLFEIMPDQVSKILLLAPDGLKVNSWYWLATQTSPGNKFFAFTMKKPGWFFSILKGLNKLGLINASIFKFVHHYIEDATVRKLLYDRWTCLRNIRPDIPIIKQQIAEHSVAVRLIYGIHDRIILSSVGRRFMKGIDSDCRLIEIASGHQVLHRKHVEEIVPALMA